MTAFSRKTDLTNDINTFQFTVYAYLIVGTVNGSKLSISSGSMGTHTLPETKSNQCTINSLEYVVPR